MVRDVFCIWRGLQTNLYLQLLFEEAVGEVVVEVAGAVAEGVVEENSLVGLSIAEYSCSGGHVF